MSQQPDPYAEALKKRLGANTSKNQALQKERQNNLKKKANAELEQLKAVGYGSYTNR